MSGEQGEERIDFSPDNEDDRKLAFDCWSTFNDAKANWWTCEFMRLVAKSDTLHTARLAIAFPREVLMYREWVTSDQQAFVVKWFISNKRSGL